MNLAVINRGVVGSGKSTFALELQKEAAKQKLTCNIHNTDEYFMVDGEYKFDVSKLGQYHGKNLQAFTDSMKLGVNIVVCDNTNTTPKEYLKYVNEATKAGYTVISVVFIPDVADVHFTRNSHNVPNFVVENMIHRLNNNLETEGVHYQIDFKPNKQGMKFTDRVADLVTQVLND